MSDIVGGTHGVGIPIVAKDGRIVQVPAVVVVNPSGCSTSMAGSATWASIARATSSQVLLEANDARRGGYIHNTDTSPLLIDLSGGAATSTRYSTSILTGETFVLPCGFTGAVTGVWTGIGTGAAKVTEVW